MQSITLGAHARVPDDWYVGFHRGLPARFWRAVGALSADDDARLVAALLDLPAGAAILDAPSGDARIAVRLAAAGHAVTAVDIAPDEVAEAARAARERGVPLTTATADLRALPHDLGPFDGAVMWGNSFGYGVPADTAAILANLAAVLRPGGRLVVDTGAAAESILPGGPQEAFTYEAGGVRMDVAQRYRLEESRLEADMTFTAEDGTVEHGRVAHHVHTTGEIARMLRAAGFGDVRLHGPDGGEFTLGEGRLIAVATLKRG